MIWFKKLKEKNSIGSPIFNGYVKFRSSIYGRVVLIITISSFFLFLSFGVIFRSVNEEYMKSVISENGNNIGFLVEGALYKSMLENDRTSLQSTLDQKTTWFILPFRKNQTIMLIRIAKAATKISTPCFLSKKSRTGLLISTVNVS